MRSSLILGGAALVMTTSLIVVGPPAAAADIASQTCAPVAAGPTTEVPSLDGFEPTSPTRIVDTRDGTGGLDAPIGAGCTMRLDLSMTSVPDDAGAAALSVTAIADQASFLTVFPCASGQPQTSNVNTRVGGVPTPNLVIATPDADRLVCIYSLLETNVIVDLTGWWTPEGETRLATVPPIRADDSRQDEGRQPVPAATPRVIDLSDIVPTGSRAVVGNLTVTEPEADGFLTAYPCDQPFPLASNLNFVSGESRAVAVAVGISADAQLCVQSSVPAHIVFDVSGYYEPAPAFGPVSGLQTFAGQRLADSRSGEGGWDGKFRAGQTRRLRPTADLANHSQSTAVVLNVVVTEAEADGFLTIAPCDDSLPTSSAVNYVPDAESTNLVVVDLAANGDICVFALTRTHVVVDLFGVLAADDGLLAEELTLDAPTWPDYDPDGVDYLVECGSVTDLGLELLRGASARVNGVPVSSGVIDVPTNVDDRITVELRRGGVVQQHSFRCVPGDFPRLEVDVSAEPTPGWYLTSLRTPGTGVGYLAILDTRGVPVWYKRVEGDLIDVQRRDDGRLVMVQSLGPRYGVDPDGSYLALSLFGTVSEQLGAVPVPEMFDPELDELEGIPMPTDHHEYLSLPDGARAVLVYAVLPADLTVLGDGFEVDDLIADGIIQEIAADDSLTWAWRTGDHFGVDVAFPIRFGPIDGYPGEEVDVYHLNSLHRVADGSGDYVASARHMDNVFRVDRVTGAVDWVVGDVPGDSPQATIDAQLTIVGDPYNGPKRPHDARLDGDILTLFDNRTATNEAARAVAYRIDESARTATLIWSIDDELGRQAAALGSNRVTADGTVVVSWGSGIQPVFGEYTAEGDPIIEITQLDGGNAYRFLKEPIGAFDADVLRATAGGSVDLP